MRGGECGVGDVGVVDSHVRDGMWWDGYGYRGIINLVSKLVKDWK